MHSRIGSKASLIPSCIHMVIEGLRNANPSPPAPLPEGEGGQRPGEGIARLNVSFCSHLGMRGFLCVLCVLVVSLVFCVTPQAQNTTEATKNYHTLNQGMQV